jgi:transketolase
MREKVDELQIKAINTIRFLSADAVQKANSGHPGLPMGAAAMAYSLWTRHLRFNPKDPAWVDRDRFILSGGHGSMLLYSLLHLTGYDLSLDEIKSFRQLGSKTPGHPEYGLTPGVETTTGPLGQGFTNGVGMAIAEAHLKALFNKPEHKIVDHRIYAIVTDGDLMEGISSEAASLAGHLGLGNLIYLYDDNHISIDGSTNLAFTEDRGKRFEAYGWHVQHIEDGNDVDAIDLAIQKAKEDPRPSIIMCRTHIGFGLPTRQDTSKAHGEPPGQEELDQAKKNMNWPIEPRFYIPDDVLVYFRQFVTKGDKLQKDWNQGFSSFRKAYPELAKEFERRMSGRLPEKWDVDLPIFPADEKGMATRAASGKVINALAGRIPEFLGGSADLTPSTSTYITSSSDFEKGQYSNRNFHFGVREHAMGGIINGMAVHKGLIPFGATFLVFSDYMRASVRLSAFSSFPSIWVWTHDSIGLGEDGPTHEPVEQLAALRAIPHLSIVRPADANETTEAWKFAIKHRKGPVGLLFSRQAVPTLDRTQFANASGLQKGAYILADLGKKKPQIILMASGTEVSLIVPAGLQLASEGFGVRLVSFPSWDLFEATDQDYRDSILPPTITNRIAVEAGVEMGWEKWVLAAGKVICMHGYGASAPYKDLYKYFDFTPEVIGTEARKMLKIQE